MSLEHKHSALTLKSISSLGVIKGYASVFSIIDSHNDYILPNAFAECITCKPKHHIKLLWQHKNDEPIGMITKLYEDDYGLYIEAQLLLNINRAQEAYELLKAQIVTGLSIGFNIKDSHIDVKKNARIISKIDLHEISLVTFPANQNAQITDTKHHHKLSLLTHNIRQAIATLLA